MADKDLSRLLEQRFWRVMLSSAFFSWQSATIIAISIIFYVFGFPALGLPSLFWLLFGVLGVGAFIAATVTDKGAQQRIIQSLLEEQFNPASLKNPSAKQNLKRALEYYSAIQNLASQRTGASRLQYVNILHELDDLIGKIFELGQRVDEFESDRIINRDRMQARRELEDMRRRLQAEPSEAVQEEIRRAIQIKEIQLENLKSVEDNVKRTDIQIDNYLSNLGTIYAQMKNIGGKSLDSNSSKRLQNEIHDMVMGLEDTISAIDDVQQAKAS